MSIGPGNQFYKFSTHAFSHYPKQKGKTTGLPFCRDAYKAGVSTSRKSPLVVYTATSNGDEVEISGEAMELEWREVANSVFAGEDQRPIVLFDGVCNLCNGGVNFALDHDPVGEFRFASLQSKIGRSLLRRSGKDADDISSIVLITNENAYFKSEAVLRIAQKLDGVLPVLGFGGFIVPNLFRDVVYRFISENRYRFGIRADSCRLEDEVFDERFVSDP